MRARRAAVPEETSKIKNCGDYVPKLRTCETDRKRYTAKRLTLNPLLFRKLIRRPRNLNSRLPVLIRAAGG